MYKAVSAALLVGGGVLVVLGIRASESLGSDLSRFFTGNPTDKTIWLLAGGVVLCGIGLTGLLRGSRAAG